MWYRKIDNNTKISSKYRDIMNLSMINEENFRNIKQMIPPPHILCQDHPIHDFSTILYENILMFLWMLLTSNNGPLKRTLNNLSLPHDKKKNP